MLAKSSVSIKSPAGLLVVICNVCLCPIIPGHLFLWTLLPSTTVWGIHHYPDSGRPVQQYGLLRASAQALIRQGDR